MDTAPLTIRPFGPEELDAAAALLGRVFGERMEAEDVDAERSVIEYDRTLAAFDDADLVACMGTYSFDMSVPGGTAPVAGTTWVGVSSTHRRRGVLSTMMSRHLRDIADRGEPLAALWASEAEIYGRFGYGVSIERLRCTIALGPGVGWAPTAPPAADSVSMVPLREAATVLSPIYEACRRRRAGMHARTPEWWQFQVLSERKATRGGASEKLVAVAHLDGRPAAYAVYGVTDADGDDWGRPSGQVVVFELAGVDAAAEAAMWRYVLSIDLVVSARAGNRPLDESLPLLLADPRRVRRQVMDALHVRVVDVAGALRSRSYADSVGVTVEVHDPLLEANDGTWRVEVAPEGVSVEPATTDTPDLVMPVTALGALYMGDVRLSKLAAAGVVDVGDPGVVHAVDSAFTATEAGWVPEVW